MSAVAKKMIIQLCYTEFFMMIGSSICFIGGLWMLTCLSNWELRGLAIVLENIPAMVVVSGVISATSSSSISNRFAVNQIRYGAVRREMYQLSQVSTAINAVLGTLVIYLVLSVRCIATQEQMVKNRFIICLCIWTTFVIYITKNKMLLKKRNCKTFITCISVIKMIVLIMSTVICWHMSIKGHITTEGSGEMVSPLLIWVIAIALGIGIVSLCIWYIRRQLRMIYAYYMNVEVI